MGDRMMKINIDSGGSFLKFCLNIIAREQIVSKTQRKRANYQEGAFPNQLADSRVKKLHYCTRVWREGVVRISCCSAGTHRTWEGVLHGSIWPKIADRVLGFRNPHVNLPMSMMRVTQIKVRQSRSHHRTEDVSHDPYDAAEYQAAAAAHKFESPFFNSCLQIFIYHWPKSYPMIRS